MTHITTHRDGRYIEIHSHGHHIGTAQYVGNGFLAYANTPTPGTWHQADFDKLRHAVEFIQDHGVAA